MRGRAMKPDEEWTKLVKGILRAEMARRGMTYDQLAEKLAEIGVRDSAMNIRNKVARGGFPQSFSCNACERWPSVNPAYRGVE